MLSRATRRIFARVGRPAVAAHVEVGEDVQVQVPKFLRFPPVKFCLPTTIKIEPRQAMTPMERLAEIRKYLHEGLRELNQQHEQAVEQPAPANRAPINELASAALSAIDLASLLRERSPLPPNELEQVYEFNRYAAEAAAIPVERYVRLGQQLYQSMMLTTHPTAWHAVGQSCRVH